MFGNVNGRTDAGPLVSYKLTDERAKKLIYNAQYSYMLQSKVINKSKKSLPVFSRGRVEGCSGAAVEIFGKSSSPFDIHVPVARQF